MNLLRAHGTTARFQKGCRCVSCSAASSAYNRRWREDHPEKGAEYTRRYYQTHRGQMLKAHRRYYAEHREQLAANKRRYNLEHKEEIAAHARWYHDEYPERVAESQRRWRERNPEKAASRWQNYRARKRGNGGTHTAADIKAQYARQKGRCFYCHETVADGYHVDHVVPLSLGGSNGPENLVVACPTCNVRKNARHPMDFAGRLL